MNVFTEQVPFLFIPEYGRICMDQVNRTAGIPVREKLPMYDIVRILSGPSGFRQRRKPKQSAVHDGFSLPKKVVVQLK